MNCMPVAEVNERAPWMRGYKDDMPNERIHGMKPQTRRLIDKYMKLSMTLKGETDERH